MSASTKSWLPAFIICAVAWGSSFLFIHVALESFTATQVAFGRVLVGAVVLIGMLVVMRKLPRFTLRELGSVALVALGLSVVPFILIPMAQQHITSILASLVNATTPLWTAFFVALLIPHERATRVQVLGLLIGAFGIAVLLGAWNVDGFPALGAALMLGATACYGIGGTLSRMLLGRISQGPTALSAVQMTISAIVLLPFAAVAVPDTGLKVSGASAWALFALGVLGTSFAYVLFYQVVQKAGATTAASVTYVVPIIATALGILVLHEEMLWYEPVGAVIVLVGVWLAQRKPAARGARLEVDEVTVEAVAASASGEAAAAEVDER